MILFSLSFSPFWTPESLVSPINEFMSLFHQRLEMNERGNEAKRR